MASKKSASKFIPSGIAPNLLLKQVENTAPFLFQGKLNTEGEKCAYLAKLRFYKKNLKALNHIDLSEYFHICLAAHWSTAGTFVPTDVDNQIREGLWKNEQIAKHIDKMAKITIAAWSWDYSQVTNRKSFNQRDQTIMSTHEGTWLSVAIGAYCALIKNKKADLAKDMEEVILAEIIKEQNLLLHLKEEADPLNFLRAAPLMAHNFGDLDRVMEQWNMHEKNRFCNSIYKLGHKLNPNYSPILVYSGIVNKKFCAKENHRHMALRKAKCLRKSHHFLIPVGPFMDTWGEVIAKSSLLCMEERAEIIVALFEGFQRQEEAFGYIRAFAALTKETQDFEAYTPYLAFDLLAAIKNSDFYQLAKVSKEEFEHQYIQELNSFSCSISNFSFSL